MNTRRFCIFRRCPFKGPAYHDENNLPVTCATEREAQLEIIAEWEIRIGQFKAGGRDFDDIIQADWIEPVEVDEGGQVHTAAGDTFGIKED